MEDIKRFTAFSSMIICFLRANVRVLLTSIQDTLTCSNLRVTFSKLITLVDSRLLPKATSSSHGHFLIDFDPKTSESFRLCSNITVPGPTIFYLRSLAKATALTNEREKRACIEALAKQKVSEIILCGCSADEVKFF